MNFPRHRFAARSARSLLLCTFCGLSACFGGGTDAAGDGGVASDGAAPVDAGVTDAGPSLDVGGFRDAGIRDTGSPSDSGTGADSDGSMDAGVAVVIDDTGIPPGAALYTLDGTAYGIREVGRALDAAAGDADNVILYVHGRACGGGGEPAKSLAGAMPDMARDYDAAPIMLLWPGADDGCPLGFPSDRALAAGPALAVLLGDLYTWELAHPSRRAALGFTLITHSLGSFVLEAAAGVSGVERLPEGVIDALVVNAAASAADGHPTWLGRVHFASALYVTVNHGDNVLRLADLRAPTPLGRSIDGVGLTPAVTYVDFTANGVNHAYYVVEGQSGAGMRAFYQAVMNGRPFDFAGSSGVDAPTARDGATIYSFNGR